MSRYCSTCRKIVADGNQSCGSCGNIRLICTVCKSQVDPRSTLCLVCAQSALVQFEQNAAQRAVVAVPFAARAGVVMERYQAGRLGVDAEVQIPPGDVAIMNELGKLVELLHAMAARVNQFVGMTDHTRKIARDMRHLATDVQEEVELRRGPLG